MVKLKKKNEYQGPKANFFSFCLQVAQIIFVFTLTLKSLILRSRAFIWYATWQKWLGEVPPQKTKGGLITDGPILIFFFIFIVKLLILVPRAFIRYATWPKWLGGNAPPPQTGGSGGARPLKFYRWYPGYFPSLHAKNQISKPKNKGFRRKNGKRSLHNFERALTRARVMDRNELLSLSSILSQETLQKISGPYLK